MRSDLKVLVGTDGKPLWDGKSPIRGKLSDIAFQASEANLSEFIRCEAIRNRTWRD
jgi:hypothetical protein